MKIYPYQKSGSSSVFSIVHNVMLQYIYILIPNSTVFRYDRGRLCQKKVGK